MKETKASVAKKDGADDKQLDQLSLSKEKIQANAKQIADQASIKGTVVEAVEAALKWRLEAHAKKT